MALSPVVAAILPTENAPIAAIAVFALIAVLCFFAPTGRRAWGRGSLVAGALFLALPLSMTVLSARIGTQMVANASTADAGATAVGATLGAGLMVGVSAFFGVIFGAIFLIMGLVLVLGGRREVIVVERREVAS